MGDIDIVKAQLNAQLQEAMQRRQAGNNVPTYNGPRGPLNQPVQPTSPAFDAIFNSAGVPRHDAASIFGLTPNTTAVTNPNALSANSAEHNTFPDLTPSLPSTPGSPDTASNGGGTPASPWQYSGQTGEQMAAAEYASQFKLIEQMRAQDQQQYGKAGADVGAMYDSLSKAMRGESSTIANNTAQGNNTIGAAYNQAAAGTNASFGAARNDVAGLAARLGVGAAVPAALSDNAKQQGIQNSLIQSNKAAAVTANKQLGSNEVNYNNQSANTEKQAGINSKADFSQRLLTALGVLDNKKLDTQSAQSKAAAAYNLNIAGMNQQGVNSFNTSQNAQANASLQAANLQLERDKFNRGDSAYHPPSATPTPETDPFNILGSTALNLYANQNDAGRAANEITSAWQRGNDDGTNWANAPAFVQYVTGRRAGGANAGDNNLMVHLATNFYNAMIRARAGGGIPVGGSGINGP